MMKFNKTMILSLVLFGSFNLFYFSAVSGSEEEKADAPKEGGKSIYVPKDYKTIKEAIKESESGDKIYVAEGNYEETGILNIKKGVEVHGSGAANTKVIMGLTGMNL